MVTITRYSSDYRMIESDIVVNSYYSWANSTQAGKYNFYNVMMHEMGHVVGLNDKYDSWATEWTMYGIAVENEGLLEPIETGAELKSDEAIYASPSFEIKLGQLAADIKKADEHYGRDNNVDEVDENVTEDTVEETIQQDTVPETIQQEDTAQQKETVLDTAQQYTAE